MIAERGASELRESVVNLPLWKDDQRLSVLTDNSKREVLDEILGFLEDMAGTFGYWIKCNEGLPVHYPYAGSSEEVLKQHFSKVNIAPFDRPVRYEISVWHYDDPYTLYHEGVYDIREGAYIIQPAAPTCTPGCEHEWRIPENVINKHRKKSGDRLKPNDVRYEVCRFCGLYKAATRNYKDPATGATWEGAAVWYEKEDRLSTSWVRRLDKEQIKIILNWDPAVLGYEEKDKELWVVYHGRIKELDSVLEKHLPTCVYDRIYVDQDEERMIKIWV